MTMGAGGDGAKPDAPEESKFFGAPSGAFPAMLRIAGTFRASALCSQKVATFK
jgi:hypothetical protein